MPPLRIRRSLELRGSLSLPAVLLALLALLPTDPALAAFAGTNGKIAFSSNRDGNLEIYSMNADGTGQARLTTNPPSIPTRSGPPTAAGSPSTATAAVSPSTGSTS